MKDMDTARVQIWFIRTYRRSRRKMGKEGEGGGRIKMSTMMTTTDRICVARGSERLMKDKDTARLQVWFIRTYRRSRRKMGKEGEGGGRMKMLTMTTTTDRIW